MILFHFDQKVYVYILSVYKLTLLQMDSCIHVIFIESFLKAFIDGNTIIMIIMKFDFLITVVYG